MSALGDVGHVILPCVRKAEKQVLRKRLDNNHRGQQKWCSNMEGLAGESSFHGLTMLKNHECVCAPVENYPLSKKCALGT